MSYTAIIVDDNIENIKILRKIIVHHFQDDIYFVGQATNVHDAKELFNSHQPQILYLAVELQSDTAFDMLDNIDYQMSQVIFMASLNEHAVKAIKYNPVDYVLKPISNTEIITATKKAFKRVEQLEIVESANEKPLKYVALSSLDKIDIRNINDVVYCEAEGRYTRFFMRNGDSKISSRNLGEYENLFKNNNFFRIHHQYLVNMKMVMAIDKAAGNYCELINNMTLPIAKRRLVQLSKYLRLK